MDPPNSHSFEGITQKIEAFLEIVQNYGSISGQLYKYGYLNIHKKKHLLGYLFLGCFG